MREGNLWRAITLPILGSVAVGWLDHLTGWEVSLFIFYALPIIAAVWWRGAWAGLTLAGISGFVWWLANHNINPYESELGYFWALINRVFYFSVLAFAVAAVRNKQDADAARIRILEERRRLEQDIVKVVEQEQQRIGQDLHDGLCQQLAAIGCAVHALADDLQTQHAPAVQDAQLIEDSIRGAVLDARNLARGIFPVHVDRQGLVAALNDLADTTSRLTGVRIRILEHGDALMDQPNIAMHLYRIVQEAVANAIKHGHAEEIIITLRASYGLLELFVEDDGIGIPTPLRSGGMGLRTMHYRAHSVGATLTLTPLPSRGTRVCCRLPLGTVSPTTTLNS
ncbi:MAG: sensor histidine kinase [Verrucomicrobiales bacterium]|nr:sensor histidine kinase [Verrucomicrobiales bacterium]